MRKSIICLLLIAIMASCLLLNVSAAAPGINLTRAELSDGKYTVTVNFADIPVNNAVEYAQILLTCRSSQHSIINNSLTMKVSGDLQVTKQFNTSADSLLVLLEPTVNTFSGVGTGAVFTFTVSQTGSEQLDPGFDLSAILILKDGTEQEINQRVSASLPNTPSQPTTSVPPVSSTTVPPVSITTQPTTTLPPVQDPCAGGHTFRDGFCIYCATKDPAYDPCANGHEFVKGFCIYCSERDPNYDPCDYGHTYQGGHCIYCLAKDPNWDPQIPTAVPTTVVPTAPPTVQPTPPSTVQPTFNTQPPTTAPDVDTEDQSEPPYLLLFALAGALIPLAVLVVILLVKKKK